MNPIQLIGRLSPKTKISLEQRAPQQKALFGKRINPDIALPPLFGDVIPFSELINQRKLQDLGPPIQYVEEPLRPRYIVVTTQPRSQTKSVRSEPKSTFSQKSYGTCSCGRSRQSRRSSRTSRSVRSRKTPKTMARVPHPRQNGSKRSLGSGETISNRKSRRPASSVSSSRKCEYHQYQHREKRHTEHRAPRQFTVNPEIEKRRKLDEFQQKREQLMNQYSAKQLRPPIHGEASVNQSVRIRIPWLCDEKRMQKGVERKSRINQYLTDQEKKGVRSQSKVKYKNSVKKDSQKEIANEPPKDPQKEKVLQARKQLMSAKNPKKVKHSPKEQHRLVALLGKLKKEKQAKEEDEKKRQERLKHLSQVAKEQAKKSQRPFKPTDEEIEHAFCEWQK